MAKLIIELNADKYHNCDALHELASYVENDMDVDIEEITDTLNVSGEHWKAGIHRIETTEELADRLVRQGTEIYDNTTTEYDILNLLEDEEFGKLNEILSKNSTTVTYSNTDDKFIVIVM